MSKTMLLYSVDMIQLALTKSNPPQLIVTAYGMAATTGWTDIALTTLETKLSGDGILDLDFVGVPPQEVFVPYTAPAVAHYVRKNDVERIVGVKVHARSNALTRLVHPSVPPLHPGGKGSWHPLQPLDSTPESQHLAGPDFRGPKTMAIGEEHPTYPPAEQIKSWWVGEESLPIAEIPPSSVIAELHWPWRDPWGPVEQGGINPFGAR